MSRSGRIPISIPENTEVKVENGVVFAKGKLGELSFNYKNDAKVELKDQSLVVLKSGNTKHSARMWGTVRSRISNILEGVSTGFIKELELVGVGFRASNQGQKLDLALGFSHNILFDIAPEVKVETISEKGKNPIVKLTSHDKQLLGYVAAKIRSFRKPEPYKGKGVRFIGEQIRRKAGKSA